MKKLLQQLALGLMVLLATAACQKPSFTVEGTIAGAPDSLLYLQNIALDGIVTVDSLRLPADGQFRFTAPRPDAPEFYVLRIHDQIINLSIDSTETVTVKAQWPAMASRYEVSGSDNCQRIRQLALMQQDLHRQAIALEQNAALPRQQAADSLDAMLRRYKHQVTTQFIYTQPEQASSYFALFQTLGQWLIFNPRSNADDVKAFAAVATSWDTFHPGSLRGQNLHNIAIDGMNKTRLAAAQQMRHFDKSIIEESGVLEINLADNHGQQRRLTSLRGKVVLLDFHSFALSDSPQRILMLRGFYNKYHDRGLEIYQVSLDSDEHFWKQMTLQLPWVSVRDAEGQSAAMYNVQAVPEFFLIDRDNQLQKRSSQMSDLDAEIRALL